MENSNIGRIICILFLVVPIFNSCNKGKHSYNFMSYKHFDNFKHWDITYRENYYSFVKYGVNDSVLANYVIEKKNGTYLVLIPLDSIYSKYTKYDLLPDSYKKKIPIKFLDNFYSLNVKNIEYRNINNYEYLLIDKNGITFLYQFNNIIKIYSLKLC